MDLRKKILRGLEEKKFKEKYYKCPNCGGITIESDILYECGSGGAGMCYCQFNEGRILNKWKRISKKEYLKIKEKNGRMF